MKKMMLCAAALLTLLLLLPLHAGAEARSSILIEAETGRVLYENNAHEALPMASTTKIMTALLALEKGNLQDLVTAGEHAFGVPGTSIYLSPGEQLTLEQMLYGLMLASGNDAAVAVAEHIGGSVAEFCRMMTARAEEIGCENTVFTTPHGLPAEGHHTTAWDLALITREAMKNPVFREIVSTQRASLPWAGHEYSRVLNNKNKLLSAYAGALGVKTGYTKAAGRCLVFAAERDGMTLIGAVLNCPDWFDEAAALLDRGFENWQMVTILSRGETVREIPVTGGVQSSVKVIVPCDVAAPVGLDAWPDLVIDLPDSLPAGIEKGRQVGAVSLQDQGETLITVPAVAAENVPPRSFRAGWSRILSFWPLLPQE
ncbi:MAG: D-alanyl-D-alanine carboxypeptidase family protein [Clostridia bacterium]|nr:D-alanyl-D-alanine carboxypeptidase family protein [Clostridia bacterium]